MSDSMPLAKAVLALAVLGVALIAAGAFWRQTTQTATVPPAASDTDVGEMRRQMAQQAAEIERLRAAVSSRQSSASESTGPAHTAESPNKNALPTRNELPDVIGKDSLVVTISTNENDPQNTLNLHIPPDIMFQERLNQIDENKYRWDVWIFDYGEVKAKLERDMGGERMESAIIKLTGQGPRPIEGTTPQYVQDVLRQNWDRVKLTAITKPVRVRQSWTLKH